MLSCQPVNYTSEMTTTSLDIWGDPPAVKKGILLQQRDKMWSRWKERFCILTRDYLHCFRRVTTMHKTGIRLSEMGSFVFKLRLVEVDSIEWLSRKSGPAIVLYLPKDCRILFKPLPVHDVDEILQQWYTIIQECVYMSKERRQALRKLHFPHETIETVSTRTITSQTQTQASTLRNSLLFYDDEDTNNTNNVLNSDTTERSAAKAKLMKSSANRGDALPPFPGNDSDDDDDDDGNYASICMPSITLDIITETEKCSKAELAKAEEINAKKYDTYTTESAFPKDFKARFSEWNSKSKANFNSNSNSKLTFNSRSRHSNSNSNLNSSTSLWNNDKEDKDDDVKNNNSNSNARRMSSTTSTSTSKTMGMMTMTMTIPTPTSPSVTMSKCKLDCDRSSINNSNSSTYAYRYMSHLRLRDHAVTLQDEDDFHHDHQDEEGRRGNGFKKDLERIPSSIPSKLVSKSKLTSNSNSNLTSVSTTSTLTSTLKPQQSNSNNKSKSISSTCERTERPRSEIPIPISVPISSASRNASARASIAVNGLRTRSRTRGTTTSMSMTLHDFVKNPWRCKSTTFARDPRNMFGSSVQGAL